MKINVGGRVTLNLGNYESFQYNLGIELEIDETTEDISEVKEMLDKYIEKEIAKKVVEIREKGREKFGFDSGSEIGG